MKSTFGAKLWVNKLSIQMDSFTEEFLARTVTGAVSSLKGADNIKDLDLHLEEGDVRIIVNGNELPLSHFPMEIITNVLLGLVSSLKGVDKIEVLKISVRIQ